MIASADWFMVVFRIVHILFGVAWVGSVFFLVMFVQPSAASIAPAGAPFMNELLGRRRLVDRIIGLAVVTIVAGLFLYWHDWHQYPSFSDWINTSFGATLTFGMVCALAALAVGLAGTRPNLMRFMALGQEVAASGGPPTPEVGAQMAAIQNKLKVYARVSLVLLVVAVLAMSSARYI